MDTAFIPLVTPRPVAFLGKAEYFTGGGLKGRLPRFLSALGYVPVERGNVKAGLAALDAGRTVLAPGARSPSTRRAPARWTGGCTAGTPASRRWRWRRARWSCRSG